MDDTSISHDNAIYGGTCPLIFGSSNCITTRVTISNGVLDHINNLRKEDDKPLDYSNVNKFFEWTVFSSIKAKQVERYRYDPELNRHSELSVEIDFYERIENVQK